LLEKGTLKIANSFGNYHSIFSPASSLNNVSYKEITIDENTTNNPMTLDPSISANKNYRTAFLWGYTHQKVTMERMRFKDFCGVWQITTPAINQFDVLFNTFEYTSVVPGITYDRTTLYNGGIGGIMTGNRFIGKAFAHTAFELHGNHIDCYVNYVESYDNGTFIVNDQQITTDKLEGIRVHHNYYKNVINGVVLWFEGTRAVKNVTVNDNDIEISPTKGGLVTGWGS
jgi:hypothetical protein